MEPLRYFYRIILFLSLTMLNIQIIIMICYIIILLNLLELKALQPEAPTTKETKEEDEIETATVDLAINHNMELLCFTTEISLDLGSSKTLRDALSGPDAEQWQAAIVEEIMNFLKRNAWQRVPMLQVWKPIPTKPRFKIKDEQDGTKCYKA